MFIELQELYCIAKTDEPYVYKENVDDFSEKLSIFDKIKPKIQTSQVTRDVKQHMFRRDMSYKGYKDVRIAIISVQFFYFMFFFSVH